MTILGKFYVNQKKNDHFAKIHNIVFRRKGFFDAFATNVYLWMIYVDAINELKWKSNTISVEQKIFLIFFYKWVKRDSTIYIVCIVVSRIILISCFWYSLCNSLQIIKKKKIPYTFNGYLYVCFAYLAFLYSQNCIIYCINHIVTDGYYYDETVVIIILSHYTYT